MRVAAALLAGFALVGCGENEPLSSGISGVVTMGGCKLPVPGGCFTRPHEGATIRVLQSFTREHVATVRSGTGGRFLVPLAPGSYVLEPLQEGIAYAPGGMRSVHVRDGRFTRVRIGYDNGMR
jgi:hypothetical protein